MSFKHALGLAVQITVSGEEGQVKGRAEYVNQSNAYLIHYRAADGRAVDSWFDESEVQPVTPVQ